KVLLHLADVDHIAIFGVQSREAGARIRSRLIDEDCDVRGAEVVEHLDLLPRRFITVGRYCDEIRAWSETAKFKTTTPVGISGLIHLLFFFFWAHFNASPDATAVPDNYFSANRQVNSAVSLLRYDLGAEHTKGE